jgi:hypothetical protein
MALAYIRHIPCLTMSGHVTRRTRELWQPISEQERRGHQSRLVRWHLADIVSTLVFLSVLLLSKYCYPLKGGNDIQEDELTSCQTYAM